MNNIVKLASISIDGGDIIKIAGILKYLKNKIKGLFDKETAQKAEQLISSTAKLKPLLNETYRSIGKIEDAISSLDINSYNSNLLILKEKLKELDLALSQTEIKTEIEKPKELKKSRTNEPRTRAEKIDEAMSIYQVGKTLRQLGINEIIPNKEGVRPLYASWAGNARFTGTDLQEKYPPEIMQQLFHNKIPDMKIIRVDPQEIDTRTGLPKKYMGEITVDSDMTNLPFDDMALKVRFGLVDKRQSPEDPIKIQIYRQNVVGITNSKVMSPQEASERLRENRYLNRVDDEDAFDDEDLLEDIDFTLDGDYK